MFIIYQHTYLKYMHVSKYIHVGTYIYYVLVLHLLSNKMILSAHLYSFICATATTILLLAITLLYSITHVAHVFRNTVLLQYSGKLNFETLVPLTIYKMVRPTTL